MCWFNYNQVFKNNGKFKLVITVKSIQMGIQSVCWRFINHCNNPLTSFNCFLQNLSYRFPQNYVLESIRPQSRKHYFLISWFSCRWHMSIVWGKILATFIFKSRKKEEQKLSPSYPRNIMGPNGQNQRFQYTK